MTNTDEVTHLRALLADATARAEKAEAACTEMRAALERHVCQHVECSPIETHAGCHARHTLSRTDLGRGMVAVPRETLERARKALGSHETCGVDFYMAAVADLDALLKKGGG